MKVIADFCIIPMEVGMSVSQYVAECEKIFIDAGLRMHIHGYGTNLEGEWDDVFGALKRCHEKVHEMGAVRISSTLRFGTRTDRNQSIQDKIDSVKEKMEK